MRWLPLIFCLALAGCMTDDNARDVVPSSAQASAPRAAKPAEARRDAKSDAKPDAKSEDESWKQGGVTRERASAMCWMKFERGHKDLPLDQRADLVNKCVADALQANPPSGGGLVR